jgi:hypothetical protein
MAGATVKTATIKIDMAKKAAEAATKKREQTRLDIMNTCRDSITGDPYWVSDSGWAWSDSEDGSVLVFDAGEGVGCRMFFEPIDIIISSPNDDKSLPDG